MSKGFTLVEVAVVATITGIIATFMIVNFQRSRVDLTLTTNEFIGVLRVAQTKAQSSARHDTGSGLKIRCGYGVRYINATSYTTYVGPDASSVVCSTLNKNFDAADFVITTKVFTDAKIEFKSSFNDIFFEPPDPKTYLNNDSTLTLPPQAITIGKIGGTCPADCKTINVYTSGRIE
ncbi:MAG: type II secretion system protein [Candidatus Paceibacterota bacterium]